MNSQEQILTHFGEQQSLVFKDIQGLFKKIIYDINFSILTGEAPTNIVLIEKKLRKTLRGNKVSSALFVHGRAATPKIYYNLIADLLNTS